jgi:hypothetical protein
VAGVEAQSGGRCGHERTMSRRRPADNRRRRPVRGRASPACGGPAPRVARCSVIWSGRWSPITK